MTKDKFNQRKMYLQTLSLCIETIVIKYQTMANIGLRDYRLLMNENSKLALHYYYYYYINYSAAY